jgi:histidine triad (HIT) family protein
MSDCVFCDIVAGAAPASIVYQDDVTLAFMDIRPITPGQIVVIPRKHAAYLADMDEATGRHLFQTTMRMAQAIRDSGVQCEGVNLFLADGEAAGQEIFHVHFLVFARFRGDPARFSVDRYEKPSRKELDDMAARIRSTFERPS